MSTTLESTVGELVAAQPGLARLFGKLGIDYCCGGKRPLAEACRDKGLDPATVLALLESNEGAPAAGVVDAAAMTMTELADHIQATHHAYLKAELPRLQPLIEKIAGKHAGLNPKLTQLPAVFAGLRDEMESHMAKEEQILFPMIRRIDRGQGSGGDFCGHIANPIRMMEMEHQQAGDAVATMRQLTDGFSAPVGACNTYLGVMHALGQLESDLHQHVHKENNILFPRAIEASSAATASSV
jgi:regulator of cell morphogenesis and NO signaling